MNPEVTCAIGLFILLVVMLGLTRHCVEKTMLPEGRETMPYLIGLIVFLSLGLGVSLTICIYSSIYDPIFARLKQQSTSQAR